MAWTSGKSNSFSKERISESDSSSDEEETPFVPVILLKNSNYLYHSNCTNDFASNSGVCKPSLEEHHSSDNFEACFNLSSNDCLPCNPASLCGNVHQIAIPPSVKRNNFPNISEISASNVKLCKSVNIAPVNSPSNRELNCPLNNSQSIFGLNANSSANDREQQSSSSGSRRSSPDNSLSGIVNQVAGSMNDLQISCDSANKSQECNSSRVNNIEPSSVVVSQIKEEKQSNVQNSSNSFVGQSPMYNWQASMTTVKERFAFLFNNEVLSDIHFRVGKGESNQRIPAHRFVLAVGSAVFDAMFNGKLSTHQEEIELPDVEPQAFLALLRFLYSDEVQIGPETVMTVLYTAKKYAVPALERQCVEYLKCNLSPDNAFMLLTQARLFDEPQLAALCLETIDKSTNEAFNADGLTDIDLETLCLVLERDTLRIREAKLFQAVVRWSESKCRGEKLLINGANQRNVLSRALNLVRFPLMTIEEFAQGPAMSNILTDKELVKLFLYFTVNPKSPVPFSDVPRCCMTGKEQTVCRFQQIESRWGYSGTSDRIRFIVDRRIFVVGFGMYGSIHGPSEYEVTIQIIQTLTGKVCVSNDTTFISDGSVNTFRVMFKEPFEVLPNTNYTANASLKGPDSHYGTKGVRKLSVECPSGDKVTFQFTYAAGNNNGTSVDDGQIPEIIFYT